MNEYEEEAVEKKLEELSDQLGFLVLDLLVLSLKKVVRQQGGLGEIMSEKLGVEEPF